MIVTYLLDTHTLPDPAQDCCWSTDFGRQQSMPGRGINRQQNYHL